MALFLIAIFIALDHMHNTVFDFFYLSVTDPIDMTLTQLRLHHALTVADTIQSKVSNKRFRRDVGHGYLIADFSIAQIFVHDKGELIGRAKTGSTLYCTNDDGRRFFDKL